MEREDFITFDKNIKRIKDKYHGECVVCRQVKELSKEHVPPRCAFNKETFEMADAQEFLICDKLPWQSPEDFKTTTLQGGLYYYSMCRDCNNKMGLLYTRAYKFFVTNLHGVFSKYNPKVNECVLIGAKLKPLNVFKQIVSMFNTLNPRFFKSRKFNVGNFLLNKDDKNFCKGVKFYIYLTKNVMKIPLQIQGTVDNKIQYLSEIVHYPLGIIMAVDCDLENECCINDFLNFSYNQDVEVDIKLHIRERNLPIIGDYRTREQLGDVK